eukprot:607210-Amphidinium_carterae.5
MQDLIWCKCRQEESRYKNKARLCVCGNFEAKRHSESDKSTVNADAHVLRAFIAFATAPDREMSVFVTSQQHF